MIFSSKHSTFKFNSVLGCVIPLYTLCLQSSPAAGAADYGSISSKVRLVTFDREFEDSRNDRTQSALGLELNYDSNWWGDVIGVGVTGYHVQELDSSGAVRSDILTADNNGDIDDAFSKIGEAYLKLKLGESAQVKIGRQKAKTVFIISSGTRAVPNTFRGISATFKLPRTELYAVAFDEWSSRHDDHFEGFRTDLSEEGAIDLVWAIGARYQYQALSLGFEHQVSTDFLRKFGLLGSYTWSTGENSSLTLSGGAFTSEDDGDLFVTGAEGGELDDEDAAGAVVGVTRSENSGRGYYLDLQWSLDKLSLGMALTKIKDTWIEDSFAGDHGRNPFPTRAEIAPDFTNTNETAWQVRLGYNWRDLVPGLSTTLMYNEGQDAENSVDASLGTAEEYYTSLDIKWSVPYLKGLNFRWLHQAYRTSKTGQVDGVKADDTDNRFYLDYVYRF